MEPIAVPFLSDEYFALADADPRLAEALAVGERVIVVWRGSAFRVVGENDPGDPFDPGATTTTTTTITGTTATTGPDTTTGDDPDPTATPVLPGEDGATPWWLMVAGMTTLSVGLVTVAALLRQRT
jgi:hypothetical protein